MALHLLFERLTNIAALWKGIHNIQIRQLFITTQAHWCTRSQLLKLDHLAQNVAATRGDLKVKLSSPTLLGVSRKYSRKYSTSPGQSCSTYTPCCTPAGITAGYGHTSLLYLLIDSPTISKATGLLSSSAAFILPCYNGFKKIKDVYDCSFSTNQYKLWS